MPHRDVIIRHAIFLFLLVVGVPCVCSAEGAWTLTTADFHSDAVLLRGIDKEGVHVAPTAGGEPRVVPLDQFLELTRPSTILPPAGKFTLHMVGGDQLGGEPIAIKGNNLVWKSPVLGEISLAMKGLLGVSQPGKRPQETRQIADVVTLANGDAVKGIVTAIGDGKIAVQTEGASTSEIPLTSVVAVQFASTGAAAVPEKAFRVHFDEGSSIIAQSLDVKGEQLDLGFAREGTRKVDVKRVVSIEQVNGPVSWLSTRPPAESIYLPYFGKEQLYPARMDANFKGDEIRFRDRKFVRGIGVHAYSRLSWDLQGASYAAFRTRFAIDGDAPLADVAVRVRLDDQVAYEQQHVRAGVLWPVVLLDVSKAKRLTLEVDFGDNGAAQDRLNWIEPALLKTMPPPEPPPPAPATAPTTQPTTQPTTLPATLPTAKPEPAKAQ